MDIIYSRQLALEFHIQIMTIYQEGSVFGVVNLTVRWLPVVHLQLSTKFCTPASKCRSLFLGLVKKPILQRLNDPKIIFHLSSFNCVKCGLLIWFGNLRFGNWENIFIKYVKGLKCNDYTLWGITDSYTWQVLTSVLIACSKASNSCTFWIPCALLPPLMGISMWFVLPLFKHLVKKYENMREKIPWSQSLSVYSKVEDIFWIMAVAWCTRHPDTVCQWNIPPPCPCSSCDEEAWHCGFENIRGWP